MILPLTAALLFVTANSDESIAVPSGQKVTYYDVIQNQPGNSGLTYRFRFLAPGISRAGLGMDIEETSTDMDFLCTNFALPRLPETGPTPSEIIISFSDRPVEFGTPSPEATQFFESYRIEDGICIWEGF